jgi:hypothetical protein
MLVCNTHTQLRTLPADALWNLSMALNVYVTVFKHYDASQLRAREPWVSVKLTRFGRSLTILVSFVQLPGPFHYRPCILFYFHSWKGSNIWECSHLVLDNRTMGFSSHCYLLWTSLVRFLKQKEIQTHNFRLCIIASFAIYISAGLEIRKKRRQLTSANLRAARDNPGTDSSFKTTEIQVTTELAERAPVQRLESIPEPYSPNNATEFGIKKNYGQYSANIESPQGARSFKPSQPTKMRERQKTSTNHNNSMESQKAAWRYTKCCVLFFISMLFTWVPSSINRVYALAYPNADVPFGLSYAAAFVLPLTGFWNSMVYITTSWSSCVELWHDLTKPFFGSRLAANRPTSPIAWSSRPQSPGGGYVSNQRQIRFAKTRSVGSYSDRDRAGSNDSFDNLVNPTEQRQAV